MLVAAISALGIFMLFLAGKTVGLLAVPAVAGFGLVNGSVGYALAWAGIVLSCATNIKYGVSLSAADLFLIPAFVIALGSLLRAVPNERPKIPGGMLLVCVALVVGTGFQQMFASVSGSSTAYAIRLAVIIIAMPVIFMVYGRTRRQFEGLLGAYVLSSAINGLLAGLDFFGLHYASTLTGNTGFLHSGRYSGLATHTTQLGMISVFATPILLYLIRRNRWWLLAAPTTLLGVLASGSRGALIGLPVGILALAICERRYAVRSVIGIAVAFLAAFIVATKLGLAVGLDRLTGASSTAESNAGRLYKISSSWDQFTQHPLLGIGMGNPYATNDYLTLLRSGGLILGVPLILLILWSFFTSVRVRIPVAYPCAAATLTWVILNLQFNGLYERYIWVPFGAAVGIAALHKVGLPIDEDAETTDAETIDANTTDAKGADAKPATVGRSTTGQPALARR